MKFKYEQLDSEIKKFDYDLKREKVSNIMKEILNDSQNSAKLQYISRVNVENLIQTVKDEIDLIEFEEKSKNPEFSNLINEFNNIYAT